MSHVVRWEISIVRACLYCGNDVASTNEQGMCPGCEKKS